MTVLKTLSNTSPPHPKKTTTDGLMLELDWLQNVIYHRVEGFIKGTAPVPLSNFPTPPLETDCFYSTFIQEHQMIPQERLALITSLASHIRPELFDALHVKNQQTDRLYTQFGGRVEDQGFVPTGATLCFLAGLQSIATRSQFMRLFQSDHFFHKKQLLCYLFLYLML